MASRTPRTLLLDADIFAFIGAAATEGLYHFDGPDSAPAVDDALEEAIDVAKTEIEAVAKKLEATRLIVCLTDEENFRTEVFPGYKGNRNGVRRPVSLKPVKDFFAANYETYKRPRLEADDCMGILATATSLIKGEKIIVSADKDMQTVPGLLFNPKKDKAPRRISKLDADRYFLRQTLTGDPTDGYPGCPGIGEKSPFVRRVMEAQSLPEAWQAVLDGYASKGRTADDAVQMARCARILRAEDWDFERRQIRLWTPPRLG